MAILEKSFTTQRYEVLYYVEETHEGYRLDQFMQIYLESWSRQDVKKKIKEGGVEIVGRPGKPRPSSTLHYKDRVKVTIKRTTQEDEYWDGELIELDNEPEIVFQDDDLLVISKPAYMATHPTGKHLFYCATVHFEQFHKSTIHSIHRLDRETSGVLLLGKNSKCSNTVSEEFLADRVKKCYFFMAKKDSRYHGETFFESSQRLGASEGGLKRVYINHFPEDSTDGKHAHTKFHILHDEGEYVLGLAFPQTGRQHQIRVHALVNGLPLVGDKLYLGSFKMFQRFKDNIATHEDHVQMELPRHALHAIALKLNYKNDQRIFRSHLPKDFIPWIKEKLSISIEDLENRIEGGIENYFKSF